MHLDQRRHAQRTGQLIERLQLRVVERRHDQQDRVRAIHAGLIQLILVDDEIFTQRGQQRNRSGRHQISERALKEALIGQHRQRRRAVIIIRLRQLLHIIIGAQQPFRR